MPNITSQSRSDAFRRWLEGIAKSSVSPDLSRTTRDLLAAIDYADEALIDSHLNSLTEAFRQLVRDTVEGQLEAARSLRHALKEAWGEYVNGQVFENFDVLGKEIERLIDVRLEAMARLRDDVVHRFAEKGYPIDNAAHLERGISDLQKFKEEIFKDWPWSSKRPAPINRQAIAEAREAIAQGQKGLHKEELVWGSDPSKLGQPK